MMYVVRDGAARCRQGVPFGLSNVLLRPSRHPSIPRGSRPDSPGTHRRVRVSCDTGRVVCVVGHEDDAGVSDGDVLRDLPHRATLTDFRTRLEVQGSTLATAGILEALNLAAGGGVSG